MAFVNLPPNLQDMFYSLSDRIMKLETGPNQAMYTAEAAEFGAQSASAQAASAQSVATQAQIQAINAGVAANNAAAQAVIAQSQATIASTQATVAQSTANGKNKVTYSTSAPGATANQVGDIWYQYGTSGTYANKVIAQFSGLGGTSWTSVTVSGLVIANIDAGAITTGTLSAIQITAGSGANSFNVSSTGVMSAQGVYVKGAIVADSGTFTGTIQAATGYFGSIGGGNYWSIGSTGLTAVGTGTITGGAINGSTITGGIVQTSSGGNSVVLSGSDNAIGIKSGGAYAGWIGSIGTGAVLMHYGSTPSSLAYPRVQVSSTTASLAADGSNSLSITASGNNMQGAMTFGSTVTVSGQLNGNAEIYASQAVSASVTAATNCFITSGGLIRKTSTTSSIRFKDNVTPIQSIPGLDPKALLDLPVIGFTYKEGHIPSDDDRYMQFIPGFIAEDVDAIYPIAADYDGGNIETWNERMIVPGLLALVQDQEARIKKLEGN